jgi:CBS domain-containing protein
MDSNELVRRRIATIAEHETVAEAVRRMRDLHVDDLVVMREGSGNRAPVGVLTDRDIVAGIVQRGAFSLAKLRVGDMMTALAAEGKPQSGLNQTH